MIEPADVETLFQKQLNNIQNRALRKKVIKTWVAACRRGGWKSVKELKKIPFSLMTKTYGINLIEHTIAVTEGAVALGKAQTEAYKKLPYNIHFDRLYAGGLLHDVGKLLEFEPDGTGGYRKSRSGKYARHPVSGAVLASEQNISEDIINTIACHSNEGEGHPKLIETVLIHQADFATFDPLVMKEKGTLIEE